MERYWGKPGGYSDDRQNGKDPATVFRLGLAAKAQTLEVPIQPWPTEP